MGTGVTMADTGEGEFGGRSHGKIIPHKVCGRYNGKGRSMPKLQIRRMAQEGRTRLMATEAQIVSPPDRTAHLGLDLPVDTPLCVDLDGTLVKSDTLYDSAMALVRQRPMAALQLPGWLMQGKAALKRHITGAVQLDVAHLPYNRELMQFLEHEHATGRPIYLATAADKALAERVAEHVGIFAGVLASDGAVNLAGKNKLAAFQSRFGDQFSYIGNASPDIPLLTNCLAPMVANPSSGLLAGLKRAKVTPVRTFTDKGSTVKTWLKAIRLHQWAKNILIFLPLLLAHAWNKGLAAGTLVAFVSFGLCASATYIVNDLLDIEADRKHLKKRKRPFASGDLSLVKGVMVVGLFSGGVAGGWPSLCRTWWRRSTLRWR